MEPGAERERVDHEHAPARRRLAGPAERLRPARPLSRLPRPRSSPSGSDAEVQNPMRNDDRGERGISEEPIEAAELAGRVRQTGLSLTAEIPEAVIRIAGRLSQVNRHRRGRTDAHGPRGQRNGRPRHLLRRDRPACPRRRRMPGADRTRRPDRAEGTGDGESRDDRARAHPPGRHDQRPLARRDCRRGRAGTTTRRGRVAPTGQRRPRALRADRHQRTDRRPPEGRPPRRRPRRGLRDHQPGRRARQQAVLHSGRTPSG